MTTSRLQKLVRGILSKENRQPRLEGELGVAVGEEPNSPDEAGFAKAVKGCSGYETLHLNSEAIVAYLSAR
jgi:hypothetical protein